MARHSSQFLRGFLAVLLIALPILAAAAVLVFWFVPDRSFESDSTTGVEIVVQSGDTIGDVTKKLADAGSIENPSYIDLRFRVLSRLALVPPLQAGRFVIPPGSKPSEVIAILTSPDSGHRVYTSLVIPPGLTSREIAERIEEAGLASADFVIEAILTLADRYPVLRNPEGLQGYLFPDTYKIEKPLDDSSGYLESESSRILAATLVILMADRYFEVLDGIFPAWTELTPAQLHEKATLASIVEREYRRSDEAPKIAAVFNNRISEGMKLQSCATVVYTIEETAVGQPYRNDYHRFNRRIFERYLEIPSPYNTYTRPGLPPGPICSPGEVALNAAFFPDTTDALFFVVKDPVAGTHTFSRDYGDHLDAREQYLSQYVVKD